MHNTSQYIPIHPIHARRFANVHENSMYNYTMITWCFTNKITCILHDVTCSGIHYMDITCKFTCMITNHFTCHFTSQLHGNYIYFTWHFQKNSLHQAILHGVTCSSIHYMDITCTFTCMITNHFTCHFTS